MWGLFWTPRLGEASRKEKIPRGMSHDAARPSRVEEKDDQAALQGLQCEDGVLSENRKGDRSPLRRDRPGKGPDYVEKNSQEQEDTVGRQLVSRGDISIAPYRYLFFPLVS